MLEIPCVIVRGGTSKGVYLRAADLPEDEALRDKIVSRLFGSPEPRQINGLGGGDPLTSKVAILSSAEDKASDVTYLSGEVRLGCSEINYGIMCGNLASGVGLAAYHLKLLRATPVGNVVRIYNANTNSLIHAEYDNFRDGICGEVNEVKLTFFSSGGGATKKILPTGSPVDRLSLDGREIKYSVVDAGAIYVFLRASTFDLQGNESAGILNANQEMRGLVERIRGEVRAYINQLNPHLDIQIGQIKVALVSERIEDRGLGSESPPADIEARVVNPQGVHRAYAVSGAICCCTASAIEDTIVNQLTSTDKYNPSLTIGHPEGTMEIAVELERKAGGLAIRKSTIQRSTRVIMSGTVYVPS
jgi:2-methylaconitate cis-trans-isomerase PrpF